MKCWFGRHKWDVYKELRVANKYWDIMKTTKKCRRCGEVIVEEKLI